jgi:hypothetical protein
MSFTAGSWLEPAVITLLQNSSLNSRNFYVSRLSLNSRPVRTQTSPLSLSPQTSPPSRTSARRSLLPCPDHRLRAPRRLYPQPRPEVRIFLVSICRVWAVIALMGAFWRCLIGVVLFVLACSGTIPCPHEGRVWLEQRGLQRALYWHIEARVVLDLQEITDSVRCCGAVLLCFSLIYFFVVWVIFNKSEKWWWISTIFYPIYIKLHCVTWLFVHDYAFRLMGENSISQW